MARSKEDTLVRIPNSNSGRVEPTPRLPRLHTVAKTVWFVYVVSCADGSMYTGITTDLERRCRQHNAGKASRYTRARLPVKLIYHEGQATRSSALKREAAIKALPRVRKRALVTSVVAVSYQHEKKAT